MSAINYYLPDTPASAASVAVGVGVYWLRIPIPFELNHINVWLLDDGDGVVLVDTGVALAETMAAWEILYQSRLLDRPLKRIIVTHHHPDHFGLCRWHADRSGAGVLMSAAALSRVRQLLACDNDGRQAQEAYFRHNGAPDPAMLADFVNGRWYRKLVHGVPQAAQLIAAGDEINSGRFRWRPIISHGHAEGHVSLYCEAAGLLISGDQVLPTITSNISLFNATAGLDPLADYLASLADFRALPADTRVLPSHGRVFTGLHTRLDEIEESHHRRSQRILEYCREKSTVCDIIPRLFNRQLDDVNWCLAFGEVHAHLRFLENQGRVVCETQDSAIYYQS